MAHEFPPAHLRDPGDAWVYGPNGQKFWGKFGAAGLLVWNRDLGVLLQHRAEWSHHGGTWGLPGGARKLGESALDGALREAAEEASVPPELLRVIDTVILDLGFWSYTTVVVEAAEQFQPVIADAESVALEWVTPALVDELPLHPAFATAWPQLRTLLRF
ncbi:ADP-ribose pyrophosphatase YjhB (NUDIX family) [Glaciihabitans tibetensis]|uniref:ADP-ribose pyrophosphatase YjhB (NUDIX family) n=1 Tax=Glaciihabitans tibetensis TaxID=1266600 RepID=A0A2T0VER5_9MICO|nr:NUDIX hydrolase [Glaciihabitans tibetensis]PRY68630.1 ADP-ribose pyrophosphatase YjhB (NUDIX family) [Glaciihabitans tibetensis]